MDVFPFSEKRASAKKLRVGGAGRRASRIRAWTPIRILKSHETNGSPEEPQDLLEDGYIGSTAA
ncbi:MAG TPA: hypothetical protein VKE93_11795 [Candidatus Angelobacter sp.]|nr:hypothetical protein [Candidatus Angelobacter sp.]